MFDQIGYDKREGGAKEAYFEEIGKIVSHLDADRRPQVSKYEKNDDEMENELLSLFY